MRVLHITSGLQTGGAETMLFRLVTRLDRRRFEVAVVSLTDEGPLGARLKEQGVPVWALGLNRARPDLGAVARLVRQVRHFGPAVTQTWLYHANVLGGLASRLAGVPVVWGLHNAQLAHMRATTAGIARVGAILSAWLPAQVVCCAEEVRRAHLASHYAAGPMVVIPNGFDLELFRPDPEARHAIREELGLGANSTLIGMVARFDPHKDHLTFVRAARLLLERRPETHFLLCGEGAEWENATLRTWLQEAGVSERFHLLGRRDDMPRLQASLDLGALSSASEGFPLAIGEAMACGVPCVATDVGDTGDLVGNTGRVVPAGNPEALAAGWEALLAMSDEARAALGHEARRRVEARFGLPAIVARYESLYEAVAARRGAAKTARLDCDES